MVPIHSLYCAWLSALSAIICLWVCSPWQIKWCAMVHWRCYSDYCCCSSICYPFLLVSHIFASLGLSYLVFKMGIIISHLPRARGAVGWGQAPSAPWAPRSGASDQQRALVRKAAGAGIGQAQTGGAAAGAALALSAFHNLGGHSFTGWAWQRAITHPSIQPHITSNVTFWNM